jgi:hypothetical protein
MTSPTVANTALLGIMFVRISTASISTRTRAPRHKATYWNRRDSIRQWLVDICRRPTWNRMKNATMGRTTATISTGQRRFGINPCKMTGANQMIAGSAPSHIAIRTTHARVSAAVNITQHGRWAEPFLYPLPFASSIGCFHACGSFTYQAIESNFSFDNVEPHQSEDMLPYWCKSFCWSW